MQETMPKGKEVAITGAGVAGIGIAAWRMFFPWIGDDLRTIKGLMKVGKGIVENLSRERYIIDMFEEHVAKTPTKPFMIFEDRIYTYELVDQMANKVANLAMTWGLPIGETVAVMIENEPALVWTFLGLQKLGLAAAMINYHLVGVPLRHSLQTSGAKILIVGQNPSFLRAVTEIRTVISHETSIYVQGKRQSALPEGYISMDDELSYLHPVPVTKSYRKGLDGITPLCYVYTSGTTGLPKPAIISQAKGMSASQTFQLFDYNTSDIVYVVTPMYHVSALLVGFFNTIDFGGTFVLRRKFSARHYWEDVRKYNVTVLLYIGELCRYLLAVPEHPEDTNHNVRVALGNGLRQDVWKEFNQRFKIPLIVEFFGATEGTGGFFNIVNKTGAVGRLSPLMMWLFGDANTLAIVKYDPVTSEPVRDIKGHCIHIKPGEQGLILCRIPPAHPGFYKGPKEMDEKKTVRDVFEKGDQWFNLGDVAYMDKDYFIYFRDRTGDTFRWKGENVSTVEVANIISELDFIRDVNVYGVEVSGADGKAGMAAIMLKAEVKVTDDILRKLYSRCERELPSYARPLFLRFMEQFVLTQTMKNRKLELVRDGFDPFDVSDPLYVIDPQNKTYKPLTKQTYQQVISSKL